MSNATRVSLTELRYFGLAARVVATQGRGHWAGLPSLDLKLRERFCNLFIKGYKLSQHEADGGKFQEREGVAVEIFPVLGEAAAPVEPRNRAFEDSAFG